MNHKEYWISLDKCNVSDFEQPDSIHVINYESYAQLLRITQQSASLAMQDLDRLSMERTKNRKLIQILENIRVYELNPLLIKVIDGAIETYSI